MKFPIVSSLVLLATASSASPLICDDGDEARVDVKYFVANEWDTLPSAGLSSLTPYAIDTTTSINYPNTGGTFAGSGRAENVAALFQSYLYVDQVVKTICITSDDGSKLFLNDVLEIDNDGVHGPLRYCSGVSSGVYKLDIEYFERDGEAELVLEWGASENSLTVVPHTALRACTRSATPLICEDGDEAKVDVKYFVANEWDTLPSAGLSSLTPYANETTTSINYPDTGGTFAGSGRADNVAALFQSYLYVDQVVKIICITSDDGSKLFLNDELKINNDGVHAPLRYCSGVSSGVYKLDIEYFEKNYGALLVLEWGASYESLTVVPHTAWRACTPDDEPIPDCATCGGDPHLKTFFGHSYSYHGQCDMVLLKSREFAAYAGLDIHIRTTRVDNAKVGYSYISGVAVKLGFDVLEVTEDGELILNGTAVSSPTTFAAGYPLRKTFKGNNNKIIVYDLDLTAIKGVPEPIQIRVNTKAKMIFVDVYGRFPDGLGLLGPPSDDSRMLARDGVTDLVGEWNSFGEEWQVRSDEPTLFHENRTPQHPQGCVYESSNTRAMKLRRRLMDGSAVTAKDAEGACSGSKGKSKEFCIADVMATGMLDLAEDEFYLNHE